MIVLVAIFVVLLVGSIAAGCCVHRARYSLAGGPSDWGEAAVRRWGPIGGPAAILVIGWITVVGVGLAFGYWAKSLESTLDKPIFDWIQNRVHDNKFTGLMNRLTLLGNTGTVELISLFSLLILAFAYRRRWWLPTGGIAIAFFSERYLQNFLAKTVERGHPPTTLGTYPSGGVGRILAVYGAIMLLVIVIQPELSRRWQCGLWTALVTSGVVEAYTRVYLSKHWFTDALFALPFGIILMLTNMATLAAIAYASAHPTARATSRPGATPPNAPRLAPERRTSARRVGDAR
jgi:hypothetical protein